jgi:polyphosphate kinase 2 (PPK2 family)
LVSTYFDYSYHEEVLVVRVYPELLEKQKLPPVLIGKDIWENREECPWYVVPADNKWFTRVIVAAAVIDALNSLDLHYPQVGEEQLKELSEARKMLEGEE